MSDYQVHGHVDEDIERSFTDYANELGLGKSDIAMLLVAKCLRNKDFLTGLTRLETKAEAKITIRLADSLAVSQLDDIASAFGTSRSKLLGSLCAHELRHQSIKKWMDF